MNKFYQQLLSGTTVVAPPPPPPPPPSGTEPLWVRSIEKQGILGKIDGSLFGSPMHVSAGDHNVPNGGAYDWSRILDAWERFMNDSTALYPDRFTHNPYQSRALAPSISSWQSSHGFWWGGNPHPWDWSKVYGGISGEYGASADMTPLEPKKALDLAQDSAFYAWIMNDVETAKKCRDQLLWHCVYYTETSSEKQQWLDMNNTSLYLREPVDPLDNAGNQEIPGHQFFFLHSNFWFKFTQIYDLTRVFEEGGVSIYSSEQQTRVETMLNGAIDFYKEMNTSWFEALNWNSDGTYNDFGGSGYRLESNLGNFWDDGKRGFNISEDYSNRGLNNSKFLAYAGLVLNRVDAQEFAKRYWKAAINYAVAPITLSNGSRSWALSDHHRAYHQYGMKEEQGYHYFAVQLGDLCIIADLFGRVGDYELLDYNTTQSDLDLHFPGSLKTHPMYTGSDSKINRLAATGKNLYDIIKAHLGYWDRGSIIYQQNRTNRGLRIDGIVNQGYGIFHMLDLVSAMPARNYYKIKYPGDNDYIGRVLTWHSSIDSPWTPTLDKGYQGSGVYTGKLSYDTENRGLMRWNWGGNYHEGSGHLLQFYLPDQYNIYAS